MNAEPKSPGMKRYAIVLMCLMLSTPALSDEEGERTFSNRQGRTFKGRIMDYDTASESVAFKRSDGKTGSMQLAMFSDADRLFIVDWGASQSFHKDLELTTELSSMAVSKKEIGGFDVTKKVFDAFYEIGFMNRAAASLEKIDFEYCIFYSQGDRKGATIRFDEGSRYGTGVLELLGPTSGQVLESKCVRLYTEGGQIGLFGTDVNSIAYIQGIWLRLKTTLPSGREIMREYRTSDDADWKWAPYSFGAGMNEGGSMHQFYYIK